jgi:hypothetical protein
MPIVRKTIKELSPIDKKRLKSLAAMDEKEIDTSDIPALSEEQLASFVPAKLLNRQSIAVHCLREPKPPEYKPIH